MKVGDLVKFRDHTIDSSPLGIVICDPPLSVKPGSTFKIEWCCKYTPTGYYQASILEKINESR